MSFRILVVEDDAMIQGFLRLTLENDGYSVTAAESAAEMRIHFQKGGIDLIMLDLGLPDADGLDLVSEIRAASTIPIVVASARQGSSDRVAALERGADDYLTKPFDPAELLIRLRNLLSRCSAAHQPAADAAPVADRRGQAGEATGDRRAPAGGVTASTGDRRSQPAPPVPPSLHAEPVSPLPAAATPPPASTPSAAPVSAEQSLQAAALKSAPQPISQAPSKPSIDKSVIIVGILAVLAFGGTGVYKFTDLLSANDRDDASAIEQQSTGQAAPTQNGDSSQPRRGALQPPSEPDVRIAQSSTAGPQDNAGNLTRSVTSSPTPSPQPVTPLVPRPSATEQALASSTAGLPSSSTAWVKNSRCAPLPNVKWWRVKTHQQVVRFVNREHKGDWLPYVNNWRARIEKLKDISDRGSGIKTGSGTILQGETLTAYIRDTADRIAIIQCLAREARIASGG